jgi:hypothetical protein
MTCRCKICDQEYDDIPEGAVPVGRRRAYSCLYIFPDATIHDLTAISPLSPQAKVNREASQHQRRHVARGIKKEGCGLCHPQEQKK